ncbi:MAG TPA: hypothetical protein VMJ66_04370 [Geobacteraceae bacterium]|nr:hypothetical protein [Geobacteraceae bacterium]
MPVTTKEISTYAVSVISDAEPNNLAATVLLCDAGGKAIAFLRFYVPGSPLAPNEFRTDLGYPLVSYPATALASIVDVLRNEKPVFFTWYDYMPVRCFGAVGTSREPVGEAEGV